MKKLLMLALLSACGPVSSHPSPVADLAATLPSHCRADTGDNHYAYCAGAFAAGQAGSLCPAGYSVVSSSKSPTMNAGCDQDPRGFDVFFAVGVPTWSDPQNASATGCVQQAGWKVGLEGCGFFNTPIPGWVVQASGGCLNYNYAIICANSADWTCPDGTLATASNKNPKHGVVCYRN